MPLVSDGSVSQTHVKTFLLDVALSRSTENAERSDVKLTKHARQFRKGFGFKTPFWCRKSNIDIEMRLRFVGVHRRELRLYLSMFNVLYLRRAIYTYF